MLWLSNIKQEQELTIDDIYLFLNSHPNTKFHYDTKPMKLSEMTMYKKNILIDYGMWNEITNNNVMEYLKVLFKLCHKWFIYIYLKEIHTQNQDLKNLMNNYKRNEDDFWWIHIVQKKYKYSFLDKLFWPKTHNPHEWIKYYLNDLLDVHLDNFLDMFELWLDFNMRVFDTFLFTDLTLRFIDDLQNEKYKDRQVNELFNELKSHLWDKKNYWWDIILSYPIKDYEKNKWFYYKILYKLYEVEIINFKEIYIQENYVNFIINKIVNFDKSVFNEMVSKQESFLAGNILNIDGVEIKVNKTWKWEPTLYYEILDLIYRSINKNGNKKISFVELEKVRWEQSYKKIWKGGLNYELFHDALKDIEDKIKHKWYGKSFFGVSSDGIDVKF